ncbi:disease resistance protein L6-like isoform X2 [Macadamia integrifolia]|uniref:disease resistance protein L6-like isoform X2 n=1 Tax=Macadamia integrifolia TaxID=60698 RepID=UPI001C4ECD80|nr:disease resistance protein L6-like isoform X2 [Macadamia integrifolia]
MAGQAEASSSALTASAGSSTYDVFLNFRGKDTGKTFTGHLYQALNREGIHVFMDSYKIREGEEIGPTLLDAIQRSKLSIPVFSRGYADSKWCLMELVKILECHRSNRQLVLPIFFDVDPSDVGHQTGSFEEAFRNHEKKHEAHITEQWRDALREVKQLKGWVLGEVENGNESKLVERVVKEVLRETSSKCLSDVKYYIGLESFVNHLPSLLITGSKDVCSIRICGISGIGKKDKEAECVTVKELMEKPLNSFSNTNYYIEGKITKLENEISWYNACKDCNKKVQFRRGTAICDRCGNDDTRYTKKYWGSFNVIDSTGTIFITLFDAIKAITRCSATEYAKSLKKLQYQKKLQSCLSKNYRFYFKMDEKNKSRLASKSIVADVIADVIEEGDADTNIIIDVEELPNKKYKKIKIAKD